MDRAVRHKSIYEPPSDDDGRRVLVTRYWPRGVSRERVDEYVPALAPSRELLRAFRRADIDWPEYASRYVEEMRAEAAQAAIARLRSLAARSHVTVTCVCQDANRCHRSLLVDLIAAGRIPHKE